MSYSASRSRVLKIKMRYESFQVLETALFLVLYKSWGVVDTLFNDSGEIGVNITKHQTSWEHVDDKTYFWSLCQAFLLVVWKLQGTQEKTKSLVFQEGILALPEWFHRLQERKTFLSAQITHNTANVEHSLRVGKTCCWLSTTWQREQRHAFLRLGKHKSSSGSLEIWRLRSYNTWIEFRLTSQSD